MKLLKEAIYDNRSHPFNFLVSHRIPQERILTLNLWDQQMYSRHIEIYFEKFLPLF
jgi:hypothetical protein